MPPRAAKEKGAGVATPAGLQGLLPRTPEPRAPPASPLTWGRPRWSRCPRTAESAEGSWQWLRVGPRPAAGWLPAGPGARLHPWGRGEGQGEHVDPGRGWAGGFSQVPSVQENYIKLYSSPSQMMGFGSDWINLPHPRVLEATNQGQGTLRLYGQHLHLQNTYYRAQMTASGFHMHDK